jgi:hypothetical protein
MDKKHIFSVMLVCLLALGIFFTGCKPDEDEDTGPATKQITVKIKNDSAGGNITKVLISSHDANGNQTAPIGNVTVDYSNPNSTSWTLTPITIEPPIAFGETYNSGIITIGRTYVDSEYWDLHIAVYTNANCYASYDWSWDGEWSEDKSPATTTPPDILFLNFTGSVGSKGALSRIE